MRRRTVRGGLLLAALLCCAGCSGPGAGEGAATGQIGEEQALARAVAMLEAAPPPERVPAATSPPTAGAIPRRADRSGQPAD